MTTSTREQIKVGPMTIRFPRVRARHGSDSQSIPSPSEPAVSAALCAAAWLGWSSHVAEK